MDLDAGFGLACARLGLAAAEDARKMEALEADLAAAHTRIAELEDTLTQLAELREPCKDCGGET